MFNIKLSNTTGQKALMIALFITSFAPIYSAYAQSPVSNPTSAKVQTQIQTKEKDKVAQVIDQHIRQTLKTAGIKVAIISIEPSNLPNMYQVNLAGQPPLHITADGQYVIQGKLQTNPSPTVATPPDEAKATLGTPAS